MSRCRDVEIPVEYSPLCHDVWIRAGSGLGSGAMLCCIYSCLCSMIPMDVFFVNVQCAVRVKLEFSRDLGMGTTRIPSPSSRLLASPLLSPPSCVPGCQESLVLKPRRCGHNAIHH